MFYRQSPDLPVRVQVMYPTQTRSLGGSAMGVVGSSEHDLRDVLCLHTASHRGKADTTGYF